MGESSAWWDGTAYPANTFDDFSADAFTPGAAASAGVIKGVGSNLIVAGTSSPVTVAAGAAWVNGKRYRNSASMNVVVATPDVNTRIDRVVLRVNYAAKTVTVQLKAGVEGGGPPDLTQTDGTTWEISLAQVSITIGGVITVTNERKWAVPRGIHAKGDIMPKSATLSGHYPIDVDLGTADADWHLCNGDTENDVVTPDLRDRMIMGAGPTYAAGTTGGAATKNLAHTHAVGTLAAANESTHTHAKGTLANAAEAAHTHSFGSHTHSVSITSQAYPGGGVLTPGTGALMATDTAHTHIVSGNTGAAGGSSGAGSSHNHTISGSTAAGSAHTHALSGSTASGGSAAENILNPYYSLAYFAYVGP
jgi:hypothetical protein